MKLSDIIIAYRKEHHLSQRKFADLCGVTNGYISMLEREYNPSSGKSIIPKIENMKKIANGMGLTLHELCAVCDDMEVDIRDYRPANAIPVSKKRIPLLGSIAAGEPILVDQEYDTYIESEEDIHCDYALRVDGDSMEPTILYGDLVFIHAQDDVDDGQIAAVLLDDSATLKRVIHIPNGLQLISDNAIKYPPRLVTLPTEYDIIRILGRAVAYKRML